GFGGRLQLNSVMTTAFFTFITLFTLDNTGFNALGAGAFGTIHSYYFFCKNINVYLISNTLISLKERIYSEDSIFIIKDTNPKSWTRSAAYDDAKVEIEKLLQA
ncbi:hypothetical protein EZS27_031437, partial [termite gut metagenome]